jgi:hypothetical protein
MKQLVCIFGLLAISAMVFPACGGPGITVESISGFTHEVSVRVPFHPPDDSVASLYIDDEGTAVFIKYIAIMARLTPKKSTGLRFIKQIRMEFCRLRNSGLS